MTFDWDKYKIEKPSEELLAKNLILAIQDSNSMNAHNINSYYRLLKIGANPYLKIQNQSKKYPDGITAFEALFDCIAGKISGDKWDKNVRMHFDQHVFEEIVLNFTKNWDGTAIINIPSEYCSFWPAISVETFTTLHNNGVLLPFINKDVSSSKFLNENDHPVALIIKFAGQQILKYPNDANFFIDDAIEKIKYLNSISSEFLDKYISVDNKNNLNSNNSIIPLANWIIQQLIDYSEGTFLYSIPLSGFNSRADFYKKWDQIFLGIQDLTVSTLKLFNQLNYNFDAIDSSGNNLLKSACMANNCSKNILNTVVQYCNDLESPNYLGAFPLDLVEDTAYNITTLKKSSENLSLIINRTENFNDYTSIFCGDENYATIFSSIIESAIYKKNITANSFQKKNKL